MLPFRELPPTAGLPMNWRDLFLSKTQGEDFAVGLSEFLCLPNVQIECSGTACFVIALETLKKESSRSSVIIPAYTCPLVPMAIKKAGLNVLVCDTQPDSFDFDIDILATLCDEDTLCVVPTHLGGLVADLAPVLKIADNVGAWVIEDAAHALGASWHGRPVGTIGDLGFFSFAAGKGLTLYEGGALVARDPVLREKLARTSRDLVPLRIDWELLRMAQLLGYTFFYNPLGLYFTYGANMRHWLKKGDPVNAAGEHFTQIPIHKVSAWRKRAGATALLRLAGHLEDGADRGRRRARQLSQIEGLSVFAERPSTSGTWPAIMVALPDQLACQQALARLWTSGLGVTKLFIHDIASYTYLHDLLPGICSSNAKALSERSLTISNSSWLEDDEFCLIAKVLADACTKDMHSSRKTLVPAPKP